MRLCSRLRIPRDGFDEWVARSVVRVEHPAEWDDSDEQRRPIRSPGCPANAPTATVTPHERALVSRIESRYSPRTMLRPPDSVVLLALLRQGEDAWTIRSLAERLHMPLAAVQRSLARLSETPAFDGASRRASVCASDELIAHALPFVAPASLGAPTRGISTAWGAAPLVEEVAGGDDAPVWPDRHGSARGRALAPLHACVLELAREDREMYEALALLDALRVGRARERKLALGHLRDRLLRPAASA